MLRSRLDLNRLNLNTYVDGQETPEDARYLKTTNDVGPMQRMAEGVRASELMGRLSTGRDSMPGMQAPPIAAAVNPNRVNVNSQRVRSEPKKNLLTRGFYRENPNETAEADYLSMWDPLKELQGADRKGEGVHGGMEGLQDGGKNQGNAAPLKIFDYVPTYANVEKKPSLRSVPVQY